MLQYVLHSYSLNHIFYLLLIASLKNLLSTGKNMELIEGIVSSLIMRLVRRMCSPLKLDGK